MTHGSLFTGIGGFDLGFEWAGIETKWQVEIDKYATKVLEKRFPNTKRFGDIKTCGKHNLEAVDIISGGFPCQDISIANNDPSGIAGEKSGLWNEQFRIIGEIRPKYAIVENVSAFLRRGLGRVLGDFSEIGYDTEWQTIPASYVGAFHKRKRIWILAYPKGQRREKATFQGRISSESCPQKPSEWEQFLSIPTRNNKIDEQWKIYQGDICGNDDGLPETLDRLKCLGNAIVPQIAYWIGTMILEVEKR